MKVGSADLQLPLATLDPERAAVLEVGLHDAENAFGEVLSTR